MKAIVDEEACIGCGLCVSICPEVFAMEDNVAVVSVDPAPAAAETACREAADSCPTQAITIAA